MEIIKYLCEFFFGNFWHFLELVVLAVIIFGHPIVEINRKGEKK